MVSNRLTAFVQDSWTIEGEKGKAEAHLGIRGHLWSFAANQAASNTHLVGGPRAHFSYTSKDKPLTTWSMSAVGIGNLLLP